MRFSLCGNAFPVNLSTEHGLKHHMTLFRTIGLNIGIHGNIDYWMKMWKRVEMPGIEPGASYMQSMRSTTELHPLLDTPSNTNLYKA